MEEFLRFLESERAFEAESFRVFDAIDSRWRETVGQGALALQSAADVFSPGPELPQSEVDFAAWAGEIGLPISEAFTLVAQARLIGNAAPDDPTSQAQANLARAKRTVVSTLLLLRLRRDFFRGLSDLLCCRISSSFSFLRLQAETVALIALMQTEDGIAGAWLQAFGDSGRAFHDRYHGRIVATLRAYGLGPGYDMANSYAMHSRVAGISYGSLLGYQGTPHDGNRSIALSYQETRDGRVLFLWLCNFLRQHDRLLDALPRAFPDRDATAIRLRSATFAAQVNLLWDTLRPIIAEMQRNGIAVELMRVPDTAG